VLVDKTSNPQNPQRCRYEVVPTPKQSLFPSFYIPKVKKKLKTASGYAPRKTEKGVRRFSLFTPIASASRFCLCVTLNLFQGLMFKI